MTSTLGDINRNTLIDIFSWIEPRYEIIRSLKLVCKKWKEILDKREDFEIKSKTIETGRAIRARDIKFFKKLGPDIQVQVSAVLCYESFPVFDHHPPTEKDKDDMRRFVENLHKIVGPAVSDVEFRYVRIFVFFSPSSGFHTTHIMIWQKNWNGLSKTIVNLPKLF